MAADFHPSSSRRVRRPMSMFISQPRRSTLDRYEYDSPRSSGICSSERPRPVVLPVVISPERSARAVELYNQYRYAQSKDVNDRRDRLTSYEAVSIRKVMMKEKLKSHYEWECCNVADGQEISIPSPHASTKVVCGPARSRSSSKSRLRGHDETQSHGSFGLGLMPPIELSSDPLRHSSYSIENEETISSMDSQDEWPWACCDCGTGSGVLYVEESPGWYRNPCGDCSIDTELMTREMD